MSQRLGRLFAYLAILPGGLVLLWFVAGRVALFFSDCDRVTAAAVPSCHLFGVDVGGFVYGSMFVGFMLPYALLWAGFVFVLFAVLSAIFKLAKG